MFALTGRRALVTGASGGIGQTIASVLHAQGAAVALGGTRADVLADLAQRLGERAHAVPADLGAPEGADALIKAAEAALGGGIDILINNAGVTRDGLLVRMKDDDWQTVLDLNLTAGFRLARTALRGMMRQRFGRIIGITSIVGATGNPGQANYAASKAGMVGFSKALAQEVAARGITVNCIAPGFIETAMTEALSDEQRARALERIPVGRFGTAADVAAAVVFLASDEAAYLTGQTLHINGGMAMF
jgi:3-oxoacyl-[acyl-carrier protein] reductase